jgi:hypothetical protein
VTAGVIHPETTRQIARNAYLDGDNCETIAAQHRVEASTVRRWCKDILRPRRKPLLPTGPLLQFLADRQLSPTAAAKHTGVNISRALRRDGFTTTEADHIAGRYHLHPYDIWEDTWYQTTPGWTA